MRADFLTSGEVNGFSWDYTSTTECDNNWYDSTKNQWTLIPYSSDTYYVFRVLSTGCVNYNDFASYAFGVRPVLYLKSDVGIVEEKETSEGLKYLVVE